MSSKRAYKRPALSISSIFGRGLVIGMTLGCSAGWANGFDPGRALTRPVLASQGMVAAQERRAADIGAEIMAAGGNAVDAAVAVGFALAVTLPRAGNLGGGGFMMIHLVERGETVALDYREMAPAGANRDMFLDPAGKVDKQAARFSHRSAGVPGTVAGLTKALTDYGTMPLAQVIAPAIALARDGIAVSRYLAESLTRRARRMRRTPATATVFYHADGSAYRPGEVLRQPDLAWSLGEIAKQGRSGFYEGEIGQRLVADMRAHRGLITMADLKAYRAVVRKPVWGNYRGYRVASMPPPSSGGTHLIQILNILEGYPLRYLGANSAESIHLMAEAMKLAYADRSEHMGDPEFWPVPVAGLTAKSYAARLRGTINRHRARPATSIAAGKPPRFESPETTHFSVIDAAGNVVSNTYTLNFSFGSGIVAAGTGILLNNEMDDFSAKPGAPNAYGLIGGRANAIEAGKRPLSSMTPTIVFEGDKPILATGSPGGSRIITTVTQIVLNVLEHGMDVASASAAPRIHHQWLPDVLRVEQGLSPDTIARLVAMGHRVVVGRPMGSVQTVGRSAQSFFGASDTRRPGAAVGVGP